MDRRGVVLTEINHLVDQQFKYGSLDCCQFAGEIARKLTGKNPAEIFAYTTEDEAVRLIEQHGSLENIVSSRLGPSIDEFDLLQDGDPCIVRIPGAPDLLGVKLFYGIVCKTTTKAITLDSKVFAVGWHIG